MIEVGFRMKWYTYNKDSGEFIFDFVFNQGHALDLLSMIPTRIFQDLREMAEYD